MLGLYRDDGNYYIGLELYRDTGKKMETTILSWGILGIAKKKETTILYKLRLSPIC